MTTIEESAARVTKGLTPYPSKHLVLEATHAFNTSRFGMVRAGERRFIRYGYEKPNSPAPEVVQQVRCSQAIDWGGSVCTPASYRVLFDGAGPLPRELAKR